MGANNNTLKSKRTLNIVFFTSILIVELILLSIVFFALFTGLNGSDNLGPFQGIAIALVILWIGVLLGYYAWALYFYNINFGLTNEDWDKIRMEMEEAKALKELGETYDEEKLKAPDKNPHKEETFGLPPGTIRGTLALSLLVGALALFIYSFSIDNTVTGNAIIRENYEFLKSAFLMMIAFYFGSRSLEAISKRWEGKRWVGQGGNSPDGPITDLPEIPRESNFPGREVAHSPMMAQSSLSSVLTRVQEQKEVEVKPVEKEVIATTDKEIHTELSDDDIETAARQYNLEVAAIKAVIDVESRGEGFLKDNRPKILFEGHIMWRYLKKKGMNPEDYVKDNEDILYPKWTKKYYKGGTREYDRLNRAKLIDEETAYMSTSWGLFQIMGFNYKVCGFDTVAAYVEAQEESEKNQLEAFLKFLEGNNIMDSLRQKDWQQFAKRYNGPSYAKNQYDYKLEVAYNKYAPALNSTLVLDLKRTDETAEQTLGILRVMDGDNELFSCKTLELPYRDNKRNISAIKAGEYKVKKRYSSKYKHHFHVLNVPNRSMILIHWGNYVTQTKGCILVGKEHRDINGDNRKDVTSSKLTLKKLNDLLPDEFTIKIYS